ncbi:metal-dependent hydrolase [Halorarius litoreus]|uniref:metal-dependent hydrolase n=1 Tax=Halorarius litoreus TaxID=2962676 RepID=UPI0020CCA3F1|nr:metal-dependent hydrolase [Halorarius litoreus]
MFVGHGLVAFAIAAAVAHLAGWSRERALAVGLLAGAFGLAPDADMVYAPLGLLGADGVFDAATGFWATGNQVHRAVTHSLLVGGAMAVAATAWALSTRTTQAVAILVVAGAVAITAAVSGVVAAGVLLVFGTVVLALTSLGDRLALRPRTVGLAAALGLLSHPFGDLLTGEPPAFLYPLDVTLIATRPELFADPTLNLLAPLYLELATAWLALGVYLWLDGVDPADYLAGRASLGVGFAGAALLLPAPTLDVSYHFVFSLLAIGALLAAPLPLVEVRSLADLRSHPLRAVVTGLTAVSVAVIGYTLVYVGLWT